MLKTKLCIIAIMAQILFMPVCSHGATLLSASQADVAHIGFADLVAKVKPAVVSVQVRSSKSEYESDFFSFFDLPTFNDMPDNSPIKRFFKDFDENFNSENKTKRQGHLHLVAQGSGFFISKDGYIVTNDHLVNEGEVFTITLDNGKEYKAKLIGRDSRTDIALLKVDEKNVLFPYVAFGDDNKVRVGDWVVAVGNPFGLGGTVTAGIVSARGRDIGASVYDDFLQIDAAVNRGNSGGPTFNIKGEVVGINTAIYSPSGGSVGIAFAIPSSNAQTVVKQLMAKGAVERGWLGLKMQTINKEIAESLGLSNTDGVLVAQVIKDSSAQKAGIKAGDVIISVNSQAIKTPRDFAKKIAAITPSNKASLVILRDNKKITIEAIVGVMPKKPSEFIDKNDSKEDKRSIINKLGFAVEKNPQGNGLLITSVDINSDAAYKGLHAGLIISSVNNRPVNSVADFMKIIELSKKDGRKALLLQIIYNNHSSFLALPIK